MGAQTPARESDPILNMAPIKLIKPIKPIKVENRGIRRMKFPEIEYGFPVRRLNGMPTRRNAKEWLEAAMNGEVILTPQQFACAKVLIEYEEAKLGRTGAVPDAETFAVRLENALRRSGMSKTPPPRPPKLIEYHPRKGPDE
jgi:hypothetical protein